ncbi:zinc finger and BTB domain-containing protein 42-like isoform X4 [Penaeus japonicus]|nr:zinc finger and BTB domain-containing protein 42-like isoform X4 [Penaeus japonicus]
MGSSSEQHNPQQQQQQQQHQLQYQQQQHHHHHQHQQAQHQQEDEKKQTYNLCWNEFPTNLLSFFKELREQEEFVDVTLACEGQQVAAHKVVLSACSPYFRSLLKNNPCDHPIIILNEVRYTELVTLLQYMYHGEVQIAHDQIKDFLRTAKLLQIRGLAEAAAAESKTRTPPESSRENGPAREAPTPTPKADSVEPEEEGRPPDSPQVKRIKLSSGVGVPPTSSPSPLQTGGPSPPAPTPPIASLPPTMSTMASMSGLPSLPPVGIPGLPLPLSLPSSITALPPVTTAHPPSIHHARAALHTPTTVSQPSFPGMYPGAGSEDTQDTLGSDRSEDREKSRHDDDDHEHDHESTLEKMSGLANMAALKGFGGFPGPSGLVGLASAALGSNPDSNPDLAALHANHAEASSLADIAVSYPGRPRFDFYRVRATDPRPCHLCGKIYKNAHTLRTHMEDKHSNCNGFRCVLCGTVAKSRNSLHSHMSRQHRGISTKDLPLLPMPAPWDPEMAAKYISMVGGVGEVVRQNYRRPDRERESNTSGSDNASRDREVDKTPTSQENGGLYFKGDLGGRDPEDGMKERRPYDAISRHLDLYPGPKPVGASLLDTYLQMMRASGMDLTSPSADNMPDDRKFLHSRPLGGGVLDLTRPEMTRSCSPPPREDDHGGQGSDDFSEDEHGSLHLDEVRAPQKLGGGATVVTVTPRSPEPSDTEDEAKWAVQ